MSKQKVATDEIIRAIKLYLDGCGSMESQARTGSVKSYAQIRLQTPAE